MKYRVGNKQSHEARCYASGGRVSEDISDAGSLPTMSKSSDEGMSGVDGGKAKPRLDRAGKKPSTTINITIGKGDQAGPVSLPVPPPMPAAPPAPPMAGPPMPPPGMPPMGAGGPPIMRKNGGRVVKKADGGPVSDYLRGKATDNAIGAGLNGLTSVGSGALAAVDPEPVGKLLGAGLSVGSAIKAMDNVKKYGEFRSSADKFDKTGLPGAPSRKTGGRVNMDAGAGSGIGRLEKIGKK